MPRSFFFSVTLLLALLCVMSVCGADNDVLAVRLLRVAIRKHDVAATRQILRTGLIAPADVSEAPTPLYLAASEREDSYDLASIVQLLLESFGESNYDYDRYHPLTRAVAGGLRHVIDALLQWPQTIPEVLALYMRCEDLAAVPSTVTVVVHAKSPRCFLEFPRVVTWDQSRLAAALRERGKVVDTQAEEDWSNPFLKPPKGRKPPLGQLVMNPNAFVDFAEAVNYYLLGYWPPVIAITYDVLIAMSWFVICAVFIASTMG